MAEPKPDENSDIADASLLFGHSSPTSPPAPAQPIASDPGEGYEIEGTEPEPIPPPVLPPPVASRPPRTADSKPRREKAVPSPASSSSGVDQIWTRGAEWGPSLMYLGMGLLSTGMLLYWTFNLKALFLWAILFLICLVVLILLAYPIFITLERPVRMTPEQAVKDYFGAFSHLVPHTKRMWLLLATDGRNGSAFHTYDEFKAYWMGQIAVWKTDAKISSPFNPFEIEVEAFKSDKSAGQTELDATYTARLIKRGQQSNQIASYNISVRLVRGSDKMWYLDAGTLT